MSEFIEKSILPRNRARMLQDESAYSASFFGQRSAQVKFTV